MRPPIPSLVTHSQAHSSIGWLTHSINHILKYPSTKSLTHIYTHELVADPPVSHLLGPSLTFLLIDPVAHLLNLHVPIWSLTHSSTHQLCFSPTNLYLSLVHLICTHSLVQAPKIFSPTQLPTNSGHSLTLLLIKLVTQQYKLFIELMKSFPLRFMNKSFKASYLMELPRLSPNSISRGTFIAAVTASEIAFWNKDKTKFEQQLLDHV